MAASAVSNSALALDASRGYVAIPTLAVTGTSIPKSCRRTASQNIRARSIARLLLLPRNSAQNSSPPLRAAKSTSGTKCDWSSDPIV